MVEKEHPLKNATTRQFAGAIVEGILEMRRDLSRSTEPGRRMIPLVINAGEGAGTPVSVMTEDPSFFAINGVIIATPPGAPVIPEYFMKQHRQVQCTPENTVGALRGVCRLGGACIGNVKNAERTRFKCGNVDCDRRFCNSLTQKSRPLRYCFYIHVAEKYIDYVGDGGGFRRAFIEWRAPYDEEGRAAYVAQKKG